jgi:AraC-like DNA-binding protein
MHCYSVNFCLKDRKGEVLVPPLPLVHNIGLKEDIVYLFNEFAYAWMNQGAGYVMKSRGYLLLILHRLFELMLYKTDFSVRDYRVKAALRYIAEHYNERITVARLASLANLNAAYFGTLFQKECGLTVSQYIMKTRVRNAEIMLQSGTHSVTEVSDYCGYSDVVHFYRQFKAVMGVAPSLCVPKRVKNCPQITLINTD